MALLVSAVPVLKLIIEDDEGRKTVVPFVRDEITIGRQEGNTIRLTERNVSRRHARLLRSNGAVVVEDLGSYNGIRLNGEKVAGRSSVADGDLIQIGDYDLAIQREGQDAPPVHAPQAPGDTLVPHSAARTNGAAHRAEPVTEASLPAYEEAEPISAEEQVPASMLPTPRSASASSAHAGAGESRRQETSIIRVDQIEAQRNRQAVDLDPEDAPRLVVLNTEFAGREFACIRTELKIGRTDDNDINLDHRSLSRTHAKLIREENGEWRIIDMQSANGLQVNGESYAQATVSHLDTIELGHLKLKFVGAGESYRYVAGKEDRPGGAPEGVAKSKTPFVIGGAAIVAVLAAVGVFIAVSGDKAEKQPLTPKPNATAQNTKPTEITKRQDPVAMKTPDPVAVAPKKDPAGVAASQILQALASARAAVEAKDLDAAISTLDAAKKVANADAASLALVEDALDAARSERLMKQKLDGAEKALNAGKYEQARKLLEDSSATEAFSDRHQDLNGLLVARLDADAAKKAEADAAKKAAADAAIAAKAEKPVEKAVPPKKDPVQSPNTGDESQRLFEEGKKHLGARQVREAKASLLKCVDINPRFAQCHLLLGAAHAKLNDPKEGARHYEIFLKLAPDAPEAARVRMMLEQYRGLKK